MVEIKTLDGSQPHESYNGWRAFLENYCEVRDTYEGVTYYGTVNCNYILFPDGTLVQNFAFHGPALMKEIRTNGVEQTLSRILKFHAAVKQSLAELRALVDTV